MHVDLTPELEELMRRKVEGGQYRSAAEVLQEALRLLDERDRLAHLRSLLAAADAELARGEVVEWTPDFMEQLIQEAEEDERQGLPIGDDVRP